MTHDETLPQREVSRSFVLDDLHVRSDGSGRVVEAYAAVFNVPAEIRDQDGHYLESFDPTAFNRTIAHRGTKFGVLFNHGRTVHGVSAGELTVPIGVPLEVRTDERGLFTVTEYLNNPLADSVLEAIKKRAIRGQSFSGRFRRSVRHRAGVTGTGERSLARIVRKEVEMREYGPAVFPAYEEAEIVGTRMMGGVSSIPELFMRTVMDLDEEQRLEFIRTFEGWSTLGTGPAADERSDTEEDDDSSRVGENGEDSSETHSRQDNPNRDRISAALAKIRKTD